MAEGWVATRLGLTGIPAAAEETMIARDISLAELTGGRLHIAHVSTAGSVVLLRQARERGIPVTAEVCPHHLTITDQWALGSQGNGADSASPLSYDTFTKVYPPLRSHADVEALVGALAEGVIDCIATDHAPHDLASKQVTYQEAAFGISVLETALGSLMQLVHQGHLSLGTLIERLTAGPAGILGPAYAGLATLKQGTPADIVLFDPDKEWVVDPREFASKGKNTPLAGTTLKGRVAATLVDGVVVHQEFVQAGQVNKIG
jgi:dihydroorotase